MEVSTVQLIAVVAGIVTLIKPFLEATILKDGAPLHDAGIRLLATALGVAVYAAEFPPALTSQSILWTLMQGGAVGAGAIGSYHLLTAVKAKLS